MDHVGMLEHLGSVKAFNPCMLCYDSGPAGLCPDLYKLETINK